MLTNNMTPSMEDYLETILFLFQRNGNVRVTDVALEMGISKPSVNKAINILKTQGYVQHEHYGLLSLTEQGAALAAEVADRHFALKRFLHGLLGVDEKKAEDEACRMEHTMSRETVALLKAYLEKVLPDTKG